MNSTSSVISIESLNFGYAKDKPILKEMTLNVPEGSIYGFLGANGAGKSTTIRSILGLLNPQSGKIKLFDKAIDTHFSEVIRKVGSLIEDPSIYKHLTGVENLKIACKYLNVPFSRIDEVLELVNLKENGDKITKKYSTGMKQRLGLAIALLSDPELLILDEPTNGLDPTGIIEFRNILKKLNEQGKTIFLSSHLLSEIEIIATQVGIIKDGAMVFQGTIEELKQLKKGNLNVNIVASDIPKVEEVLAGKYPITVLSSENIEVTLEDREDLPGIINDLVAKGIRLFEVSPKKDNLEKMFINLTTKE